MPSFIPKTLGRPQVYPDCVDLDVLFSDERFRANVARVIDYLHPAYVSHSDGSFDHTGRPGVVTEQFYLAMPTVDAHIAEIELCNAIWEHALGNVSSENIKMYLQKYFDTHVFVYKEVKGKWIRELKSGVYRRTSWRSVPLFSVDNGLGTGEVLNAIQLKLFLLLQLRSGNNAQYRITEL